jgi:hypothetical protein
VPSVVLYLLQDQLVVWFVAGRAGPVPLAEMFALGRIAAIYALLGTFVTVVLIPWLTRQSGEAAFRLAYAAGFVFVAAVGVVSLLVVSVAPAPALWLIGPKYAHLTAELPIVILTAAIGTLAGYCGLANRVRGWVAADLAVAAVQAVATLAVCWFWTYATTRHLVALQLAVVAISAAGAFAVGCAGMLRPALVALAPSSR